MAPDFPDEHLRQHLLAALDRWENDYLTRLGRDVRKAIPDLKDRLREAVAQLTLWQLSFGPGDDFRRTHLDPAFDAWFESHIRPILDDARRDLMTLIHRDGLADSTPQHLNGPSGVLGVRDVLAGLALPAGLLIGGGAVAVGVTTATRWVLWQVLVFNWPLIIAGVGFGTLLTWVGVVNMATVYRTLTDRLSLQFFPAVEAAIVGDGVTEGGKHHPSLLCQLQTQIRQAAQAVRNSLKGGGRA
jgi:hypothetical protein